MEERIERMRKCRLWLSGLRDWTVEIASYRQVQLDVYIHETAEAVSQTAVQQWRLTHSVCCRSDTLGSGMSANVLSQAHASSGRADYFKPRLTVRKPLTTRKVKRTTKQSSHFT